MFDTDYDSRIIVLKYSNIKREVDFKYEVIFSTGMVRKYDGDNYPDLPINILTTLYMIDEYPAEVKESPLVTVTRVEMSHWTHAFRANKWQVEVSRIMNDEFLDKIGRKLEIITAPEATVTAYSVIVKASDIRRMTSGNTGEQGQGKSEEDTD